MRAEVNERECLNLDRLPGVELHFAMLGRRVKKFAVAFAPERTHHYVNSLEVQTRRRPRLVVYVLAKDFKAHWIEWGAGPSPIRGGKTYPPHHVLERAARAVGLNLRTTRKGGP